MKRPSVEDDLLGVGRVCCSGGVSAPGRGEDRERAFPSSNIGGSASILCPELGTMGGTVCITPNTAIVELVCIPPNAAIVALGTGCVELLVLGG